MKIIILLLLISYMDHYDSADYVDDDGSKYCDTSVVLLTDVFCKIGFIRNGKQQKIGGISLYPALYFSPYDYVNAYCENLENSYSVHHFAQSWLPMKTRLKTKFKRASVHLMGRDFIKKVRKYY